ncbi:RutC family protein [Porphyridium purpureum]|uniref:RutC family protein n=1 Tax=Porphyridium purpureum TaxID=35688 RepID=A0A5J4YVR4_PORPP|nr:RutC family protein [Porphyridium purpureum]|eukprot:POR7622..scf209_3
MFLLAVLNCEDTLVCICRSGSDLHHARIESEQSLVHARVPTSVCTWRNFAYLPNGRLDLKILATPCLHHSSICANVHEAASSRGIFRASTRVFPQHNQLCAPGDPNLLHRMHRAPVDILVGISCIISLTEARQKKAPRQPLVECCHKCEQDQNRNRVIYAASWLEKFLSLGDAVERSGGEFIAMETIVRYEPGTSFSQMVVHGGIIYLAGQVTDDEHQKTTVGEQTSSCLAKIDRLLEMGGGHKSSILSASVWLADIATVAEMNAVWNAWVDPECKPVRATVEAKLVRPTLLVEVQVVAAVGAADQSGALPKQPCLRSVQTELAGKAVGPYSQAVVVEDEYVFVSGCLGLDPKTDTLVDGGIETQAVRALANLEAVLKNSASGSVSPRIVRMTLMVKDMRDFGRINDLYGAFLNNYHEGQYPKPARTAFQVAALPKEALVMIDAIARL